MNKIYDMFQHSAELSLKAGFDGIQIHMGHGYLIDQFLDANVNNRKDEYGGSIENRIRFSLELLESLKNKISLDRVSVRISPSRMMNGLYEWPDKYSMLTKLLREFDLIGLRQLDISCANSNYYETSVFSLKLFNKFSLIFIKSNKLEFYFTINKIHRTYYI